MVVGVNLSLPLVWGAGLTDYLIQLSSPKPVLQEAVHPCSVRALLWTDIPLCSAACLLVPS